MTKFTDAIILAKNWGVQKISGTPFWRVNMKFVWYLDYQKKNLQVVVSEDTITDFGSIPRFLWFIFNPTEWISYILHDELYRNKYVLAKDWKKIIISREQADQILYQALLVEGCAVWSAKTQYVGLRLFWWIRWKYNITTSSMSETILVYVTQLLSAKGIKAFFSSLLVFTSYLFWGIDQVAIAFLVMLCLDFIFWFSLAWKNDNVQPERLKKGTVKFLLYGIVIIVWNMTDIIIFHQTVDFGFKNAFMIYLWVNEAISILKKCQMLGVPLPPRLLKKIEKIRDSVDVQN